MKKLSLLLYALLLLLPQFSQAYFDPSTGTWISRDPLGETGGVNLYAFCNNDPVNNIDPDGLVPFGTSNPQPYSTFELMFPAQTGRADLMEVAYDGGLYGAYGVLATPGYVAAHPKVQGSVRMAGGLTEAGVGIAYMWASEGVGAFLGGTFLYANGVDNFKAGLNTFQTEVYHPAILERGITRFAGDGVVGNGLYLATQLGMNFAPTLGAKADRLLMTLDWAPVLEPYRMGYLYSGVPFPGLPRFRVPSAEVYKLSLETKVTPLNTVKDIYEVANTGPTNYLIKGGGAEFWADGIAGTTILEAKFVMKPRHSPFIPGTKMPPFLRAKITQDVDDEFRRMAAILGDPANPLVDVEVIVNDSRANQFFIDLLKKYGINGRVVNR